ncbi:hypothetical protein CBR_g23801 [Chara braunii]|uniref:Uncharacterized protein n=1 Tax=Chara braunii TaxID=69332 RepID=A0A388JVQ6_CHABU|nr:hypothetical protein CBR_g23801 [Chara braunii]|eukprot:GBG61847.1 hypothetical protein CBR_g23801 [Chara braunii]
MAMRRDAWVDAASQCQTAVARVGAYGAEITSPALPFLAQTGAAGAVFLAGLVGFQYAGYVCGISCVTPALGPMFGCAAVGVSSVAAGQAAAAMHRLIEVGDLWPNNSFGATQREEILLHALMGIAGFKALGGSFRNVMPSNLGYPGALARFSIPAKGEGYAVEAERAVIRRMFKQFGCHHCGRRSGGWSASIIPKLALRTICLQTSR